MPRFAAIVIVALATATLACVSTAQSPRKVTDAEVARITRDAILIDTHDDVTSKTVSGYDIAIANKTGQTDLPRMKGFLGAEFFAVFVNAN